MRLFTEDVAPDGAVKYFLSGYKVFVPDGALERAAQCASSIQLGLETSAHNGSDHAADDGSGHKFGEPMDGHRNAKADVERIDQGEQNKFRVPGIERDQAGGHGKRHGGVRRRPAPENAALEKPQLEAVAAVNQRPRVRGRPLEAVERRRKTSGEGLVAAGNQIAKHGRLSQSPGRGDGAAVFPDFARQQKNQSSQNGQEAAHHDGRAGDPGKRLSPGRKIIRPVDAGPDDEQRQDNSQCVPPKVAAAESGGARGQWWRRTRD